MSDTYFEYQLPHPGRPPFLEDDDRMVSWSSGDELFVTSNVPVKDYDPSSWRGFTAIRIPRDHWAVTALEWNEKHPDEEPFIPIKRGSRPPHDWVDHHVLDNDGDVLFRGVLFPQDWERGLIAGYRQKKETTEMVATTTPTMAERLEALVRNLATDTVDRGNHYDRICEARELVEELDENKLRIEARELIAADPKWFGQRTLIRNGEYDAHCPIDLVIAALQRGQELAKEED